MRENPGILGRVARPGKEETWVLGLNFWLTCWVDPDPH